MWNYAQKTDGTENIEQTFKSIFENDTRAMYRDFRGLSLNLITYRVRVENRIKNVEIFDNSTMVKK